jgi:transposase
VTAHHQDTPPFTSRPSTTFDHSSALRGVDLIVAATFVSEVGDIGRFDNPRQLMGYLGLVPSERSTGRQPDRTPHHACRDPSAG